MIEADDIPDHWDICKIGDVIEKAINGGTPKRSNEDYWEGDIPWLSSSEVRGKYTPEKTKENITKKGLEESSAKIWPKDTVLVAMYGRGTIGRPAITSREQSGNQAICGLIPDEKQITTDYLYYWLRNIRRQLANKGRGATASQQNLNQGIIKDTLIPVPPVEEQKQIVSTVENKIQSVQEVGNSLGLIKNLIEEFEDSAYTTLFYAIGEDVQDITDLIENQDNLPLGWNTQNLDELVDIESGSRPKGSVDSYKSEVPSIGGSEIDSRNGDIEFEDSAKIPQEFYESMGSGVIQAKDILIVKDGANTGDIAYVDDNFRSDAAVNSHVYILRPDADIVDPEYLANFLRTPLVREYIEREAKGAAQKGINMSFADDLTILIPPFETQKSVVKRIRSVRSNVDEVRTRLNTTQSLSQEYEDAVLEFAFRGDLKV